MVSTPPLRVMKDGMVPVVLSTMAEIDVEVAQVPMQDRIEGVASSESELTVPWEITSVSVGSFFTVVVIVCLVGASQPT